jgi:hypothetical protein
METEGSLRVDKSMSLGLWRVLYPNLGRLHTKSSLVNLILDRLV